MERPISHATIINLEHFPAYEPRGEKRGVIPQVTAYLKALVDSKLEKGAGYLELPSFSTLAEFFKCSYLEIYDIFRTLRNQGYDYQFSSLDGTVLVWISKPTERTRMERIIE